MTTIVHYSHNYIEIDVYPQGDWIDRTVVVVAWILFTATGIAGYVAFTRGLTLVAGILLLVYSYAGLSSLGHYFFEGTDRLGVLHHVTIVSDGIAGAAMFAFSIWLLAHSRKSGRLTQREASAGG